MKSTANQNSGPIFIDFEASSLGEESFPISVAWGSNEHDIEYHLINPAPVCDWDDWDDGSEFLHELTREKLEREGSHPLLVCNRLLKLRNQIIFSDEGFDFDRFWLERLMSWAGEKISHGIAIKKGLFCVDDSDWYDLDLAPHNAKNDVIRMIRRNLRESDINWRY